MRPSFLSRRNSITGSRESLLNSAASMASLAASGCGAAGGETLGNIRRVTETHESVLGYSYRNDAGELVLVNIYDISDTDPVEIIGDDILMAQDEDDEEDEDDNELDLDEDLHRRLQSVPMERFMNSKAEDEPGKEPDKSPRSSRSNESSEGD